MCPPMDILIRDPHTHNQKFGSIGGIGCPIYRVRDWPYSHKISFFSPVSTVCLGPTNNFSLGRLSPVARDPNIDIALGGHWSLWRSNSPSKSCYNMQESGFVKREMSMRTFSGLFSQNWVNVLWSELRISKVLADMGFNANRLPSAARKKALKISIFLWKWTVWLLNGVPCFCRSRLC